MNDRASDILHSAGALLFGMIGATIFSPIPFVGAFGLLFAFFSLSFILGTRLFPQSSRIAGTGMGIVSVLGLQALVQTGAFYLDIPLSRASDPWLLVVALCFAFLLSLGLKKRRDDETRPETPEPRAIIFAMLLSACSLGSLFFILNVSASVATTESIRSPWLILPPGILAAVAGLWISALVSAKLVGSKFLTSLQSALALFGTTAIVPLVYRIGFGFDGFLHVASEKILLATGTLNPHPPYYIGQYVLTTWLSRLGDLPVAAVDRWLVPVSAALLLPFACASLSKDRRSLATGLLLLPLFPFIATTPQSFSYVIGLFALLLAFASARKNAHPIAPLIAVFWSLAIHPLAGLPFLCATLAVLLLSREIKHEIASKAATALGFLSAMAAALAVPVAFYALGSKNGWNWAKLVETDTWRDILGHVLPWTANSFVVLPAWTELVSRALFAILVGLCVLGLKELAKKERLAVFACLLAAILILVSAALLKAAGDFAFLIDYERGNYADRLYLIALLLLIPGALFGFHRAAKAVFTARPLVGAAGLALFLAVAAAQTYGALPRHDALVIGRGWSVSATDLEATRFIDRDAGDAKYAVLADQSVSAAAVSELGFKRYAGDVFFYPIPTGGPLYEIFLRLTYNDASIELIKEAGQLADADIVYIVINDYWYRAEQTNEALSAIAQKEWDFGTTRVYRFDVRKSSRSATTETGS